MVANDANKPFPPGAIVFRIRVADFDRWLAYFDKHEDLRREAGIVGHHINRAEGDPDDIVVYLAVSSLDAARAFAASDGLRERMEESGVVGTPEVTLMTQVREAVIWDRELPASLLNLEVADFDRWLEGYDSAADLRRTMGIIGGAATRSIDDPTVALVYHQAESFDTLRTFLADDEFKERMRSAGVVSAPEVSFVTGGWAKRYV